MGLWEKASKTNTGISLTKHFWSFLGALGVQGQVQSFVWLAAVGIGSWTVRSLGLIPPWAILLGGMAFAAFSLHIYNKARVAWSLRGLKKLDLQTLGQECRGYFQDVSEFYRSQQFQTVVIPGEEPRAQWQRNVDRSRQIDTSMATRFAPRAFAIAQQLKSLGIPPPELFHFVHGDHSGASVYIGMVGELLSRGLLDEARKLDPRSTWGASFRV